MMKKYKKIEDMPQKKLEEIIKQAMDKKMPEIKTMPYLGEIECKVIYEYPEMVALCPMTGYLDTYKLTYTYTPNKLLPELKSLRFYLMAYKDMRIGHEHLCAKLYRDFKKAVKPKKLKIELDVAIRGGIHTLVSYEK